jgi:hypothetical protein
MLIYRLIYCLLSAIKTAGFRHSLNGLSFASHVLTAMLSVQPATVRKKPWRWRGVYPRSWMLLSTVMLNMPFVSTVHAELDWEPDIVVRKTREAVLFFVIESWYNPPDAQPPDPGPWGSLVSQDEWVGDHVHRVIHQTHFANEYVGDEAASLSAFLALTQWRLQRVSSTQASKEAEERYTGLVTSDR